jgi:hypothetical protein
VLPNLDGPEFQYEERVVEVAFEAYLGEWEDEEDYVGAFMDFSGIVAN